MAIEILFNGRKEVIYIPLKDTEHCIMNIFNTETGENLGQIGNIKEVNMVSKDKMKYERGKHGEISRLVNDTTYELTFNADKPIDTEEFYGLLGIDTSNMPDAYDIQFVKFVQARKHKKRRINKKWLKRYGYKQMIVDTKGCKMKYDTDDNVEFVK